MATSAPAPIRSLLELCFAFLSRRLHYDIIKYRLFQVPKLYLTGIKDQLSSLHLNCRFTDIVLQCALDDDYTSLPSNSWSDWCLKSVKTFKVIEKLAIVIFDQSKLFEWSTSEHFAVTEKELLNIPQAVGTYDSGKSLVFEGKKYIIFSSESQIVLCVLYDPEYKDELNATNSDKFCIVAALQTKKDQQVFLVAISTILKGELIPNTISKQRMLEEMMEECRYLTEYFGYVRGECPMTASSAFN